VKLVFIYGPPAVGKLTVGKALAKQTGFRLFHNHLAIDTVKPVFDFGTPSFWKLVGQLRKEVLEEAAKEGVSTIFTFVYAKGEDDETVKEIVRAVKSHGGEVCFVRLYCAPKELGRRVANKSRKKIGKLTSRSALAELSSKFDLTSEVPFARSLSLETTKASPEKVSAAITKHFGFRARNTVT
jgi:shikimate kinase